MNVKSWARHIGLLVLGAVLALVLSVCWEKYKQYQAEKEARERQPEILLKDAEKKRSRLTESDLASAVESYKQAAGLINGKQYPDENSKHRDQARAFSGLSRTYSDWAMLRFWRGLSRGDYPDRARDNALEGVKSAPGMAETEIALAFAYDSAEAGKSPKSATQGKVNELLAKRINTLELQYLAWTSGADKKPESFLNEHRAEEVSELRTLVAVGLYCAKLAHAAASTERQTYIDRGSEFLDRAAQLSSDNSIVLFAQGTLSGVKQNMTEAQAFYQKALDREPEFPKARNNFGVAYFVQGDYQNARKQFEASAHGVGAPITNESLMIRLDNLASACLELEDDDCACQSWKQASEVPGANEDLYTYVGLAVCAYKKGYKDDALTAFRRAVELNKEPIDLKWFEQEKAGPKELKVAKVLIQMAK